MSAHVLLLHGQPGGARDWDGVAAAIGSRAELIAFDRPGWNGRGHGGGLAENARAAQALLDARDVERAVVVGHSFGGAVAAWLAACSPERVSGLVLAAPSANLASLVWLDHALGLPVGGYLAAAAGLGCAGLALSWDPLRRRVAGTFGLDARYLAAASTRLSSPRSWRTFYTEQRALLRELPGLEARLGAISAPTTIVSGTQDRIVPLSSARQLAEQIPSARLTTIPGAGHLLPLQFAGALADAILTAARG